MIIVRPTPVVTRQEALGTQSVDELPRYEAPPPEYGSVVKTVPGDVERGEGSGGQGGGAAITGEGAGGRWTGWMRGRGS